MNIYSVICGYKQLFGNTGGTGNIGRTKISILKHTEIVIHNFKNWGFRKPLSR